MKGMPEGWVSVGLLNIVDLHDGRRVPLNAQEREARKGPYPYYGANGQVDSIDDYLFDGDYILLAEDGGYFDEPTRGVAYEASGKFWVNNHAHIISPCGDIPRRFLTYSLNAIDWMPHVGGSTRLKLTQEGMRRVQLLLPPLAEQKRIVEKLDRLMARSGRAREEIERIPKFVERYKQAVLAAAFSGELTKEWCSSEQGIETAHELIARTPPLEQPRGGRDAADIVIPGVAALSVNNPGTDPPDGWAWVSLNRIARQETGHTPSRSHPEWWGGNIPWIGIKDANAHHGGVIYETFQHTNSEGLANSAARLLPAGTVCLSRTASVGYVVMMGRDMATSQDFVTWTCTKAIEPRFLMYAIMAEGEHIRRFGKGSTHTTIYFPEVRALHICLAPLEEQREIIRRVEAAFALINTIVLEVTRSTELLDRLDRQTLAKAFRGELVSQDPNDEPASILLKRIQNARTEEINGRQKGRARRENGRSLFE